MEVKLILHMEQAKAAERRTERRLEQDSRIGPVFARTLNKMGLHTFVQIARWKTEDITKVQRSSTPLPNDQADKWIDEAKKEHYRKYGERL